MRGGWRITFIALLVYSLAASARSEKQLGEFLTDAESRAGWSRPLEGFARWERAFDPTKNSVALGFYGIWLGPWMVRLAMYAADHPDPGRITADPGMVALGFLGGAATLVGVPALLMGWAPYAETLEQEDLKYRRSLASLKKTIASLPRPHTAQMQERLDAIAQAHPRLKSINTDKDQCGNFLAFVAPRTLQEWFVVTTAAGLVIHPVSSLILRERKREASRVSR